MRRGSSVVGNMCLPLGMKGGGRSRSRVDFRILGYCAALGSKSYHSPRFPRVGRKDGRCTFRRRHPACSMSWSM